MTGLWVWVKEGQTIESATALTQGLDPHCIVICDWVWSFHSMEELEQFVRHFAEDKTVITPCAIPVKSTKEDVKKILASWLDFESSAGSEKSNLSTDNLSLSPHKPEPTIPVHQDRWNSMIRGRYVPFLTWFGTFWFEMFSIFFGQVWPRHFLKPQPWHWSEKEVVLQQVDDCATFTPILH